MKAGWMKSWLCVSAIVAIVAATASALPQGKKAVPKRNELTLHGIRPGKDTISEVRKRTFGKKLWQMSAREWLGGDPCGVLELRIETDEGGLIESVDIGGPSTAIISECRLKIDYGAWVSGRGLHLHDEIARVIEIYGEPGSRGPSVKNGQELELLYYAFDWAGSDVPQVMEVSCDKESGRVVEIMLAFPSL